MSALCRLLQVCVVAVLATSVCSAAPLDLDRVPADTQWLMHIDMDAARESTVVRRLWERAMKMHPHAEQMMGMFAGMLGMDPRKDLHDATAYGLEPDKRNAVLVIRARMNRELLEKMVAKAPDHERMPYGKHTLHTWTQKGWKGHKGERLVGSFHGGDVVVVARSAERVKSALDVLDGAGAAARGEGPLGGRVRPGSIVVARAATVDPDTKCPVLHKGRAFRVAVGEHDGISFYRARLEMQSAKAAELVEDVVEGMEAVARLRFGDDGAAARLIDGLEAKTNGASCQVSWTASADEVWAVVAKLADRWEQKQRAWQRDRGGKDACGCGMPGCKGCGKCPFGRDAEKQNDDRPLRDDEF